MKKAVFLDIDGTLLDAKRGEKEISPRNKKAIRNLQKDGHYVFIATGRPVAFLNKMFWDFGFDGFIVNNGAQVLINGESVYQDKMDSEFIKELAKTLDKHQVEYMLEGSRYAYLKKEFQKIYDFTVGVHGNDEMVEHNFNLDKIHTYKVCVFCENEEHKKLCYDLLEEYPEYDAFQSIRGNVVEIYKRCNHKAKGIEKALEALEIPIESSYAIGDGKNDIEMLQAVGCGIAMGNAADEVKACAKHVTETLDNDGVAVAIENLILKEA